MSVSTACIDFILQKIPNRLHSTECSTSIVFHRMFCIDCVPVNFLHILLALSSKITITIFHLLSFYKIRPFRPFSFFPSFSDSFFLSFSDSFFLSLILSFFLSLILSLCSSSFSSCFFFFLLFASLLFSSLLFSSLLLGVREHCQFLKQIEDASSLRRAIAYCFERANIPSLSKEEIKDALSFVIVGAGPTGVRAFRGHFYMTIYSLHLLME